LNWTSTMAGKENTTRQLRNFGLIVGAGFAVVALVPVLRGHSLRAWALGLTFVLAIPALIFPRALRPLYRWWMALAEVLAWVNTRIILLLVYYGVLVPTGALLRVRRKDLLRLQFEKNSETYRMVRAKRPATHMQRQY